MLRPRRRALILQAGDSVASGTAILPRVTAQVRRAGGGPVPVAAVNSQDWNKRLCQCALAEGAITEPKAAELLGISFSKPDRWMQAPPGIGLD